VGRVAKSRRPLDRCFLSAKPQDGKAPQSWQWPNGCFFSRALGQSSLAAHEIALSYAGISEGLPGLRARVTTLTNYGAYFRDPDGKQTLRRMSIQRKT